MIYDVFPPPNKTVPFFSESDSQTLTSLFRMMRQWAPFPLDNKTKETVPFVASSKGHNFLCLIIQRKWCPLSYFLFDDATRDTISFVSLSDRL
mmetsp:Transcript_41995/g.67522  ORF Transcript_41995/g.67522 Transcript_41995/m.67522 type:complete len:93 (-) Transcript_41995:90-368(-)